MSQTLNGFLSNVNNVISDISCRCRLLLAQLQSVSSVLTHRPRSESLPQQPAASAGRSGVVGGVCALYIRLSVN